MDYEQRRYKAFLSYSSNDRLAAENLHKQLESYRIPKPFVGQTTSHGQIPASLFPIFRDRDELPSSADLGDDIKRALAASESLIVVCSPSAVASRWVSEEILTYKRLGRESRILAYVIDGEPNIAEHPGADQRLEAFPTPLRFKIGPDGALSDESALPLAADPRPTGDGIENAKLKIVSGLIGVGLDVLKQREREAARLRGYIRGAVAASIGVLAVIALIALRQAWQSAQDSQREQTLSVARQVSGSSPEIALPKLLEVLPRSLQSPNRPFVPEAMSLLALTFGSLQETLLLEPSGGGQVENIKFAAAAPVLLTVTSTLGPSVVTVWSALSGMKVFERQINVDARAGISADGRVIAIVQRGQQFTPILIVGVDGVEIAKLTLAERSGGVESVSLNATGKFVAVKTYNGEIIVLDIASGAIVHQWLKIEGGLTELFFSDDGRYLVALHFYNDDGVQVFDLEASKLVWSKRIKQATSAVFFEGSLLVGQYLGGTTAFDLKSGDPISKRSRDKEAIVGISRDGTVSAWRAGDTIYVRGSSSAESILSKQTVAFLALAAISGDGKYIAMSENASKTVRVRSVVNAGPVQLDSLTGKSPVSFGVLSADGDMLLVSDRDGQIKLIDAAHRKSIGAALCNCGRPVSAFINETADRGLIVGADAAVLYRLPDLVVLRRTEFKTFSVTTASADRNLKVVALEDQKYGLRLLSPDDERIDTVIETFWLGIRGKVSAWLSPNGRYLAIDRLPNLTILDLPSKKVVFEKEMGGSPSVGGFDASSSMLAVAIGAKVSVIDVAQGSIKYESPALESYPISLSFSGTNNDQLLVGGDQAPIQIMSAHVFHQPSELSVPIREAFPTSSYARFSSNKIIALRSIINSNLSNKGSVVIWNTDTREVLYRTKIELNNVYARPKMVASENGRRAFVFGDDVSPHLIDINIVGGQALINEACRRVIKPLSPGERSELSPGGWMDLFAEVKWLIWGNADARPATCPPL